MTSKSVGPANGRRQKLADRRQSAYEIYEFRGGRLRKYDPRNDVNDHGFWCNGIAELGRRCTPNAKRHGNGGTIDREVDDLVCIDFVSVNPVNNFRFLVCNPGHR